MAVWCPPAPLPNVRDLGGLATEDGMTIRPGRLLRSAALAHAAPASLDALTAELGPATYVDLRTDREVDRDGGAETLVARGWRWCRFPVQDLEHAQQRDGVPAPVRYEPVMSRYVEVARAVAANVDGSRATVVACSLGNDRTGMVVALLLSWLRVGTAEIIADFLLSNVSLAATRHLLARRWRDPAHPIGQVTADDCLAGLATAAELLPAGQVAAAATLRRVLLVPAAGARVGGGRVVVGGGAGRKEKQ